MKTVYLVALFVCATHAMNVPDLLESMIASLCSAKEDISMAIAQAKSDCPFCSALAYYLGGSDRRVEGTFYWENPLKPVVYTNWFQPPDNTGGDEHCIEIRRPFGDYKWNDYICNGNINFICEKTL